MRSSVPLYDALADGYANTFNDPPYKRIYDLLAWEHVSRVLPTSGGLVIDAGCGTGRWVDRLLQLGHDVIGIEQSPQMIRELKKKEYGPGFTLVEGDMEKVSVHNEADAVLAMGSLQYTRDPAGMLRRFAAWTKFGGTVSVLVDSFMALVLELIDAGKTEEALERLRSAKGVWKQGNLEADLHLLDSRTLEGYFYEAGVTDVVCKGLLVTASAWGRHECAQAVIANEETFVALERKLSEYPVLADAGKQLLVTGRRNRGC